MDPSGTIGTRLDGYSKGFEVPMTSIKTGRIIFFLASRNDCEKMVTRVTRRCVPGRQYVAIHGGTTLDFANMSFDCWCFCANVVEQAITVPDCHDVVDFLQEMKPSTVLLSSDRGLICKHNLVRRRIGESTSKQRR